MTGGITFAPKIKALNVKYFNTAPCHCEPKGRGNLGFHGIASSSREARHSSQ